MTANEPESSPHGSFRRGFTLTMLFGLAALLFPVAAPARPCGPHGCGPGIGQWVGTMFSAGKLRVTTVADPSRLDPCSPGFRARRTFQVRFADPTAAAVDINRELRRPRWTFLTTRSPARSPKMTAGVTVEGFAPVGCPGPDGEAPAPERQPTCRTVKASRGTQTLLYGARIAPGGAAARIGLRGYSGAGVNSELMGISAQILPPTSLLPARCQGAAGGPYLGVRRTDLFFSRLGGPEIFMPLTAKKFFALRRRSTVATRVTISGSCERPVLTASRVRFDVRRARASVAAPFGPPAAVAARWPARASGVDEDLENLSEGVSPVSCVVEGEAWLLLRRTGGTRRRL